MDHNVVFPHYDFYKDSGVIWIGEIPSDWELKRLATVFDERKQKVSDKEFPPLSVTKNGVLPQLDSAAKSDDGDNRKGVRQGDFVINSRSDRKGSSGIAKQDGSVSLINIVLKPKDINPRYSEHLLKSNGFIEEFYRNGHGIVADLWTTRYWDMKSIYIPFPDIQTQDRIANFLDQKTAEIDEAIAKKQRLIELLKELKAILINQAVTKGLNPDVPMRDSGVEWIGEVPEHWEIKRIKHVTEISPSKNMDGVKKTDEIVTFLPMEKLSTDGTIDVSEKRKVSEVFEGFTYFAEGDVVIAKITPCFENGKGTYLEHLDSKFGFGTTELHVLRPRHIDGNYLYQRLNCINFLKQGEESMVGSAGQKRLPTSFVENYLFGMPPFQEQSEIFIYCKDVSNEFQKMLSLQVEGIERLSEYKQILISSTVTGKIKI
jgi:type I restriction enzyme, S subunit